MISLTCEERKTAFLNALDATARLVVDDKLTMMELKDKVARIKDIVCGFPVGDCCTPATTVLGQMEGDTERFGDAMTAITTARTAVNAISCSNQNWRSTAYDAWELVDEAQRIRLLMDAQVKQWKEWYKTLTDAGCHIVLAPDIEEEGEG